eukprot:SAG31_NODE_431_length_15775_cov_3.350663_3_plen_407_part_00
MEIPPLDWSSNVLGLPFLHTTDLSFGADPSAVVQEATAETNNQTSGDACITITQSNQLCCQIGGSSSNYREDCSGGYTNHVAATMTTEMELCHSGDAAIACEWTTPHASRPASPYFNFQKDFIMLRLAVEIEFASLNLGTIADNVMTTVLPSIVVNNALFAEVWDPINQLLSMITIDDLTFSYAYNFADEEFEVGISGMAVFEPPSSSNDVVNCVLTILADASPHVFVEATKSDSDVSMTTGFGLGITCLDSRGTTSSCAHDVTFTDEDGNTVCCAEGCGTCGGDECASAPGGEASCCPETILDSKKVCSVDDDGPCGVQPCRVEMDDGSDGGLHVISTTNFGGDGTEFLLGIQMGFRFRVRQNKGIHNDEYLHFKGVATYGTGPPPELNCMLQMSGYWKKAFVSV